MQWSTKGLRKSILPWVRAPNLHQCLRTCVKVRKSKRLSRHADLYTVGRCRTRGESEESVVRRQGSTQARESTLALKPKADVTRSPKQGYQWPHEKDLCPPKIFLKKIVLCALDEITLQLRSYCFVPFCLILLVYVFIFQEPGTFLSSINRPKCHLHACDSM